MTPGRGGKVPHLLPGACPCCDEMRASIEEARALLGEARLQIPPCSDIGCSGDCTRARIDAYLKPTEGAGEGGSK